MDHLKLIITDLTRFTHDVLSSYSNLSTVPFVIVTLSLGLLVSAFFRQYTRFNALHLLFIFRKQQIKSNYKDGVIYVHVFPSKASKKVPTASPFVLKLETWLRLHKVKHERVETTEFSKSTGQIPYIIYNGKEYADSELIIDFLQKKLNIKDDITPAEMGIQRAFISMIDERLFFVYILHRLYYVGSELPKYLRFISLPMFLQKFIVPRMMGKWFRKRCIAQGIGRKPRDVINSIGNEDLKALSLYLGDKKFLAGDKITRADCTMFGHLTQLFYVDLAYPQTEFMRRECPNLEPYITRIKTSLWPDWDTIVDNSEFS